ncbi:hypothetical protein NMY22_g3666 [Coprinellus aureogranulatus]|nr:hypothetical protein NMY22_g3666 [Coprinellus aureogranulatus]
MGNVEGLFESIFEPNEDMSISPEWSIADQGLDMEALETASLSKWETDRMKSDTQSMHSNKISNKHTNISAMPASHWRGLVQNKRIDTKERRRKEREERRKTEKIRRASQQHLEEQRSSDDSRSRRQRENRRSDDERKERSVYITPDQSRTESYYAHATQSIYLSADPEGRVERRPSTATTRPTSELPSAADMNALRAKEAWDMERMWKARSMYGAELNGNAVQSIPTQSVLSFSDNLSSQGASYGSSYTAFALQTPFAQGHPGPSMYHSMPGRPPPIIYGSPASIPSLPDSALYDPYDNNNLGNTPTPQRQRRTSHRASSPPEHLPVLSRSPLAKNPLPEPPRESTYQPAPLPPLKPATATVRTSDYWAKYAGVTTNA